MNDRDTFDPAERLLGRFDFASQLAANEEDHRRRLRALLLSFIEVMDSFDRLFSGLDEHEEVPAGKAQQCLKSCRLIRRQLDHALSGAGVSATSSLMLPAEPGRHEIVGVKAVPGAEEGVIVEEVFRGYTWDGETLRKPQVIVAQANDHAFQEK